MNQRTQPFVRQTLNAGKCLSFRQGLQMYAARSAHRNPYWMRFSGRMQTSADLDCTPPASVRACARAGENRLYDKVCRGLLAIATSDSYSECEYRPQVIRSESGTKRSEENNKKNFIHHHDSNGNR